MPKVVVSAVVSTLASKAVDAVFGGGGGREIQQAQPQVAETSVSPIRDDEASRRAAKNKQLQLQQRGGRKAQQLTALSSFGDSGTLG